jgi:valyl-tRNA synthetase
MIMAGYAYEKTMPFRNVYFTGIVRDKLGRKMSKSLGNSPDPLDLIERFGADGVRMGLMLAAPAGNDIPFDEALCEQGRNFNNKIWNAFRLVKGWQTDAKASQPETAAIAIRWFDMQLSRTVAEMDDAFGKYRLNEAMMAAYKLFWDEFSAWYLELAKPEYGQPVDAETYRATLGFFDALLRLLHPFMPFITEALWQELAQRQGSIMYTHLPKAKATETAYLAGFERTKEIIGGIRAVRLQKNIPNKQPLELHVNGEHDSRFDPVILKLSHISRIASAEGESNLSASFLAGTTEYAVPLGVAMDVDGELLRLRQDLDYQEGFLASVMKKLGNDKFVANAKPEVVAAERKKQADAESKIHSIRETISQLNK